MHKRVRVFSIVVLSVLATAVVGVSVAWACTTGADMTLSNNTAPNQGKNFTNCAPPAYPNGCGRSVQVIGHNFVNSAPNTAIASVDLYWIDEPFFGAGVGLQGPDEQVSGTLCSTKGVRVATAVPVNQTTHDFSVPVTIPPPDGTYADRTPRPLHAYYGANAVCAVWTHTLAGGGQHISGFGNQYNIFPA